MPRPWYHPQVLTAFVALQDIADDMGPTDFLPATHTSTCHEALNSEEGDGRALDLLLDTWPVRCCCAAPMPPHVVVPVPKRSASTRGQQCLLLLWRSIALATWQVYRGVLGVGDVSLYDSRLLHAGGANISERRRVLFYCSFIRASLARTSRGTLRDGLRGKRLALCDWREWLL